MKRKACRRNDGVWWVKMDDDVDVVVAVDEYNVVVVGGGDVEEGRA